MKNKYLTIALGICGLLAACEKEVPPRTVQEFRANPILLEATMVRCAQNRSTMKYEVECVNARTAINLIARADDNARRAELDEQSERKRRALRRAQEAASEARRRADEAERLRREAEYLGQFDALPNERLLEGEATAVPADAPERDSQPATDEPAEPATGSDLNAIREELQQRQN